MLGWEVYVMKPPETFVASWCVGIGGLAWLDDLVKEGVAQNLGGNGYPCKYSASAKVILPRICPQPPKNENAKVVIGDDYILSGTDSWKIDLVQAEIDKCQPSDVLIIEAWDMS